MIRPLIAVLLSASTALAQTFIVDAANGPGADFSNLQTAIDTVPDGSILRIRPGTYYGGANINGKGLSLLATASGVIVSGMVQYVPIMVANLAPTQSVILRGLSSQPGFFPTGAMQIGLQWCAGPVLIEDYYYDAVRVYSAPIGDAISIIACSQVSIRNCHVLAHRALIASSSTVVVENSDLIGGDFPSNQFGQPGSGLGIEAVMSTMVLSRCHVRGGNGPPAAQPAIQCYLAHIRLCDDGNGSYLAGQTPANGPLAAIVGTGTVVRDPSPVVTGSNGGGAVDPQMQDIVRPLPSLHTVSASPGGTVHVDITTPVGELVLLALALPGPVMTVPGVDGEFWLDPATAALMTFGIPQPGVPVQYSIAVPPGPAMVGTRCSWQAVAFSAADGLRASNPSTYSH